MVWLVATILAWVTGSLVRVLEPLVTWIIVQILGRIPRWPFLALTPARTACGRSVTVAVMVAGLLGIVAVLSPASGPWLSAALIAAAVVVVGGGLAYATLWWPAALAGALLGVGLGLDLLPYLSPWAARLDEPTMRTLVLGAGGLVLLAFLSTAIAIDALRPRALPKRSPNNPWGTLGKESTSRSAPPPRSREPE